MTNETDVQSNISSYVGPSQTIFMEPQSLQTFQTTETLLPFGLSLLDIEIEDLLRAEYVDNVLGSPINFRRI